MKTLLKSVAIAGLLLGGSQAALAAKDKDKPQAAAPTSTVGPLVPGLAIASRDEVIANSNAFKVAQQQRPITYKATIDAAQSRAQQIDGQLKPLVAKLQADSKLPNPNQAALQQQYNQIQQIQQAGQQEVTRMMQPVQLSEAYVIEQIDEKLEAAVQAAMAKNNITVVLGPQATFSYSGKYNLSPAIVAELNQTLPSAQLVPPQGWEPREMREARAAQAAQQGGPAPAPAAGQPAPRQAQPVPGGR
jgi:Skp family chaperone for outer membrane proteins